MLQSKTLEITKLDINGRKKLIFMVCNQDVCVEHFQNSGFIPLIKSLKDLAKSMSKAEWGFNEAHISVACSTCQSSSGVKAEIFFSSMET